MKPRQLTGVPKALRTGGLTLCAAGLGALLASGLGPVPMLEPPVAQAADVMYISSTSDLASVAFETEIEQLTFEYDRTRSASAISGVKTAAVQTRVNALEARIPAQQERSDAAMVELYKMQQRHYDIIEMLLASDSIDDFVKQSEYFEKVSRANLKTINEMKETRELIDALKAEMDAEKTEADRALEAASGALEAARAARASKAASGLSVSGVSYDGADWHMTEEEFVNAWAPRIDAYLAGSPLSGQGATFARASWKYCVDPRWSPAISNTESSKGARCIRPHNAWGWGAADSDPYNLASEWGSWEEAIDAHVRGLSEGFGYTISKGAAQGYCPPSWEDWYNNTRSEMEMI